MGIRVEKPEPPEITVNGTVRPNKIDKGEKGRRHVNHGTIEIDGDATISFSSPQGADVCYTLNGRNPTLGSPVADGDVVVRYNGDGFSWDNTIVKAKAYHNGDTSDIVKLELKLRSNPSAAPLSP